MCRQSYLWWPFLVLTIKCPTHALYTDISTRALKDDLLKYDKGLGSDEETTDKSYKWMHSYGFAGQTPYIIRDRSTSWQNN